MTTPGAPNVLASSGPKLGDFTQSTIGPNVAALIWSGQEGVQLTLANQDLINSVTIARRPNFIQNGSNTAVVPALGSITVDGSRSIWALAPAGTAPLLIFPGGGNWAPSPAQVAAQINALGLAKDTSVNAPAYSPITTANAGLLAKDSSVTPLAKDSTVAKDSSLTTINGTLGTPAQDSIRTAIPTNIAATGVPLLRLASAVASGTAISIPASGTINRPASGNYTMSQIGFYLYVSGQCNAASTVPFYTVTLNWTDSATGILVNIDQFVLTMASNAALVTAIYGNVYADRLQIQITNNDTVNAMTFGFSLINTSSIHTASPLIIAEQQNLATVPGFTNPGTNSNAGLLVATSPNVAASATANRLMPVYSGQVYSSLSQVGVSAGNFIYNMVPATTIGGGQTSNILDGSANVSGNAVYTNTLKLPRLPMLLKYINNGTVAAGVNHMITTVSSE